MPTVLAVKFKYAAHDLWFDPGKTGAQDRAAEYNGQEVFRGKFYLKLFKSGQTKGISQ